MVVAPIRPATHPCVPSLSSSTAQLGHCSPASVRKPAMHTKMYASKGQICTLAHATIKADEYVCICKHNYSEARTQRICPQPHLGIEEYTSRETPILLWNKTMTILAGDFMNDKHLICNCIRSRHGYLQKEIKLWNWKVISETCLLKFYPCTVSCAFLAFTLNQWMAKLPRKRSTVIAFSNLNKYLMYLFAQLHTATCIAPTAIKLWITI